MLQFRRSVEPEKCEDSHDCWLAMRSAYEEYRKASETLENSYPSAEESGGDRPLTKLQVQQRIAFEGYLEARMAFLELWFHQSQGSAAAPAASTDDEENHWSRRWLAFANQKPVLQVLSVLLIGTTAFCLVREQTHVRDLVVARGELQAARNHATDQLQLLGQKVDALESSDRPVIQPKTIIAKAKKQPPPKPRLQKAGMPPPKGFSLTPSGSYQRVGPIEVAVRSVDVQRKTVSLFILSDRVTMDMAHVQQNQPIWIKAGNRRQLLGLVIDRIAKNRLEGHLIGPMPDNTKLKANGSKSGLPAPSQHLGT